MPSNIAKKMFPNLKIDDVIDDKPDKDNIIKDNKLFNDKKNSKQSSGKKMGRPPKDPETRKKNLSICIEPKYRDILEKEAKEKEEELGPYIVNTYIKEPLKKKYKNL